MNSISLTDISLVFYAAAVVGFLFGLWFAMVVNKSGGN